MIFVHGIGTESITPGISVSEQDKGTLLRNSMDEAEGGTNRNWTERSRKVTIMTPWNNLSETRLSFASWGIGWLARSPSRFPRHIKDRQSRGQRSIGFSKVHWNCVNLAFNKGLLCTSAALRIFTYAHSSFDQPNIEDNDWLDVTEFPRRESFPCIGMASRKTVARQHLDDFPTLGPRLIFTASYGTVGLIEPDTTNREIDGGIEEGRKERRRDA